MNFDGKLRAGFVLDKPLSQENYDKDVLKKLENENLLIASRKRDGWKIFISNDNRGVIRFYTSGIEEITDNRFDNIKNEITNLLPRKSLIVGEIVYDLNDKDDLGKVISFFKNTNIAKIKTIQKNIKFFIFNIIFWKGKRVETPYFQTIEKIKQTFSNLNYIKPIEVINESVDRVMELVEINKWEGAVFYNKNYIINFRTDGKEPKRPQGCYKLKNLKEDDFIVREVIFRPNSSIVKELVLLQIDPITKKEFECGKLGSFKNKIRNNLAGMNYPLVVQVEFESRFEKTGKIRSAKFMRFRDDKLVIECIAPKSFLKQ